MSALLTLRWLNSPAWLPLIHALLHTLWHGALAAGGLWGVLRFVPARRAGWRYDLSAAALALVVLAGIGTWAAMDTSARRSADAWCADSRPFPAANREGALSPAPVSLPIPDDRNSVARSTAAAPVVVDADRAGARWWVHWTAAGWLLGVCVCLLRAAGSLLGAGRLRRRCRALTDGRVLALAEGVRARLRVSRRVRFLVCDEISVPSMLGVLYPAVLLPAFLLTGVPTDQLRAILAHELAHVRRWDYLANLAQTLVEAILFFNPFVWWINRQIWLEREACCGRVAAGECPSPSCYVEALVAVIEHGRRHAAPPLLAISGPDRRGGQALERARRLLAPGYQPALRVRWFSLAAVIVLASVTLGGLWLGARAVAQTVAEKTAPKLPDASQPVPDLPANVLAALREGDKKRALKRLEEAFKPKKLGEEEVAGVLDALVRARELRAFTTLHDALAHSYAEHWQLGDGLLAGLIEDRRTNFLDALLARRFDPDRLTKAAASADPAMAAWITRRVAEVNKQRADIEALERAAADNDLPAMHVWSKAARTPTASARTTTRRCSGPSSKITSKRRGGCSTAARWSTSRACPAGTTRRCAWSTRCRWPSCSRRAARTCTPNSTSAT